MKSINLRERKIGFENATKNFFKKLKNKLTVSSEIGCRNQKKSKFGWMKKHSFLFFLTLISWQAQSQKSFFGVDAGINVANQRVYVDFGFGSNSTLFFKNTVRPAFGVFYQLDFSNGLAFRANAQYMGLGYKADNATVSNLSINYLTIPLTLFYSVNHHLRFNAGPYVSFTIGGTKINNQDITKTFHKNDFGFGFGAEHDLYKNFALGINYYVGLKNIWLADINTSGGTIKYTNRALQFTLIYKFKKPNKIL